MEGLFWQNITKTFVSWGTLIDNLSAIDSMVHNVLYSTDRYDVTNIEIKDNIRIVTLTAKDTKKTVRIYI